MRHPPLNSKSTLIASASASPDTPLLRWAGSKKKLLPLLQQAAPKKIRRYIEPFAGSAVLFLRLQPSKAILSDINTELIHTYEEVRTDPDAVWKRASSWSTEESFYYELRAVDVNMLSSTDRAARFVYLNRFCFNGVYRTNRKGQFNVARGRGYLGIPCRRQFRLFAERLSSVDLRCTDFQRTVSRAGAGDFVYLDPPYAGTGNRDRGEYGPGTFKEVDLDRLAEGLKSASSRGSNVLISYADQPSILRRFRGWHVRRLQVTRNVCGFADARRTANEVLISNYAW